MRIGKVNKHKVEIYDSIDELPIQRFQKYNKFMLIDSGVGSDLQDILNHIGRAQIYIKADPAMAIKELENMKQAVYIVHEELSPKNMAFAVLVKSIDGEPMDDLSDTGLKRVLDILKEAKKGWIDSIMDAVKKKIDQELNLYFPGRFDDASVKEFYDEVKQHTLLKLKHIITGEDTSKQSQAVEVRLALLARPRLFSGAGSAEIAYDKEFEAMCLVLAHNINIDPYKLTVLQFFNAFEFLQKQAKRNKAK